MYSYRADFEKKHVYASTIEHVGLPELPTD